MTYWQFILRFGGQAEKMFKKSKSSDDAVNKLGNSITTTNSMTSSE